MKYAPLTLVKTTKSKKSHTKTTIKAEPIYTKLMADKITGKKLAEIVGANQSTIYAGIKSGKIYKPIELACEGLYNKDAPKSGEVYIAMKLPPGAFEVLKPWLDGSGIKYTKIGE